ncbi:uncharacterized protein LOC117816442 isoform X2 [Notolabrus celidotus]|uniref:uncharacterized protein LOC117816442 isoform X2 n=1 Tax=Notolabrus celidotus TaxID=1203425 RepID=UPI00149065EB|nr:uncharacterized protein LOC117816442 isoform X2 [Notolabrus celidotus]
MDMSELQSNISASGLNVYFEVSLRHKETLNLTLFGHSNLTALHIQPPEEEEEEEGVDNDRQLMAFYCCLPVPPMSRSANQSHCLLWLSNQTVMNVTAKEELPWKRTSKGEWRSAVRVLWLLLLCVVLLTVVTTVIGKIYWRRCCGNKLEREPVNLSSTDAERHAEDAISSGNSRMILRPQGSRSWSGLSPIQEVDHQDGIETLLDGHIDNCYTVNLHHRGHPSTSEDQPR